jgi:hypothetical protein
MANLMRAEIDRMHRSELISAAEAYRRAERARPPRPDKAPRASRITVLYRKALAAVALSLLMLGVLAGAALAHPMGAGDGTTLGPSRLVDPAPGAGGIGIATQDLVLALLLGVMATTAAIVVRRRRAAAI